MSTLIDLVLEIAREQPSDVGGTNVQQLTAALQIEIESNGESTLLSIFPRTLETIRNGQFPNSRSAVTTLALSFKDVLSGSSQIEKAIVVIPNILEELKKYSYLQLESAEFALRETLFDVLVATQQFLDAARVMAAFNFDTRILSNEQKADYLIKIAECYLMEKEPVDADAFTTKAGPLMNDITDVALILRYRVAVAQVLDANRKFVDAALRYYELSNTQNANVVCTMSFHVFIVLSVDCCIRSCQRICCSYLVKL